MKSKKFYSMALVAVFLISLLSISCERKKVCTCSETNLTSGSITNYSASVSRKESCASLNISNSGRIIVCEEN